MPADLPLLTEPRVGGPAEIDVLPAIVDAATMPAGPSDCGGRARAGRRHRLRRRSSVACLEVPDGEHVLVAGPPRSGRTTALHRLVTSWVEARPGEQVVSVSSRRRALLPQLPDRRGGGRPAAVAAVEAAVGRPCLLVVDDAEHVDDPRLAGCSPSGDLGCSSSPRGGRRVSAPCTATGPPWSAAAASVCCSRRAPTPMATCWASSCRGTGHCRPGPVWPGWSPAAGVRWCRWRRFMIGFVSQTSCSTLLPSSPPPLRSGARPPARSAELPSWRWLVGRESRARQAGGTPPAMTACGPCGGPSARRSSPRARRPPRWRAR